MTHLTSHLTICLTPHLTIHLASCHILPHIKLGTVCNLVRLGTNLPHDGRIDPVKASNSVSTELDHQTTLARKQREYTNSSGHMGGSSSSFEHHYFHMLNVQPLSRLNGKLVAQTDLLNQLSRLSGEELDRCSTVKSLQCLVLLRKLSFILRRCDENGWTQ